MVRFSRVWRGGVRMGPPQVRWSVLLMTQHGEIPAQFQGDCEGQRSLTTKLGGMCVIACLAEGLGIRGTARVFEVDPNTVLQWLVEAAEQLRVFSQHFLHD